MRDISIYRTVRSVALLAALVLAPLPLGNAATLVDPLDLLEIEVDDIAPPAAGSAWVVTEDGPPLAMRAAGRPGLAPDRLVLPIGGIESFGYEARVSGGALRVLVDGTPVTTLGAGTHVRDLALWTGNGEVVWEFVPDAVTDQVWVVLQGARPLLAPVLQYLSPTLLSWCGEDPWLYLQLRYALPLGAGDVELVIDGETVPVRVHGGIVGDMRSHWIHVPVPYEVTRTKEHVDLIVRDVYGTLWDLLDGVPIVHETSSWVWGSPHGWVYDLRPSVEIMSTCMRSEFASHRLFIDGVDVTDQTVVSGTSASYTFDRDLAFAEEHTWRFESRIRDGAPIVREGTFQEGLDVLEMDVPSLELLWTEGDVTAEGATPGLYHLFADLANPHELPPVVTPVRAQLADGLTMVSMPDGAHLRAVYAPLALACYYVRAMCDPYGGAAPGFSGETVTAATLTLTDPHGRSVELPGAGQFAAASAAMDPHGGAVKYLEGRRDWAKGLAETAAVLVEEDVDLILRLAAEDVAWARAYAEARAAGG